MFVWLSTKKSTDFGKELAKMPQDTNLNDSKRASKSNYAKEKMRKRIAQFKQEEILNFYKTAKLLNSFKWELKDAGYDKEATNAFASWILICLRS
jgi:hypothetical protein